MTTIIMISFAQKGNEYAINVLVTVNILQKIYYLLLN